MSKELRQAIINGASTILASCLGWGILYSAYLGIEHFSVELGGWRYLLYFITVICWLVLVITTVVTLGGIALGIIKEGFHFLGWILGCAIHFKISPYVSIPATKAYEARIKEEMQQKEINEKNRRVKLRIKFLDGITAEQEERYNKGFDDTHQQGIQDGLIAGKKIGYDDGYNHRIRQY